MKTQRRRYLRHIAAAVAAMVAVPLTLVVAAAPAAADPWPFNSNFRPDKGNHNYCYSSSYRPRTEIRTQIYNSMVYMHNNTKAKRTYHSSCDTSGVGQTDVVWQGRRLSSGAIGDARCMVKRSNGRCDRYRARINGPLVREHYSNTTYRNRQYRKTTCHELGHTLGLNHYPSPYNDSCQRSGWTGTISSSWTRTWTAHHRGHINSWFG
ncbi:hypothetical protein [Amycolatopsis aidingensis]|uniref:hypothetical protein n=1 Tax=Amycolatopsis aidingensis TaxID=2842453 RepID=UPI001C0C4B2D|nr:hypothetical protein [Amycolatopsis aidingensis]